ncbi:hypothetical protein pdam_00001148 [Pocillopora damicornis]|uniref:Uncharacterized protein n=1 Tax=Pocillopora damicornis TaxID=46731 RepID=A0A3M6V2D7_POCDA|nr:hypothetical protein pdam_00001148 [Pocillopora damicornis]
MSISDLKHKKNSNNLVNFVKQKDISNLKIFTLILKDFNSGQEYQCQSSSSRVPDNGTSMGGRGTRDIDGVIDPGGTPSPAPCVIARLMMLAMRITEMRKGDT